MNIFVTNSIIDEAIDFSKIDCCVYVAGSVFSYIKREELPKGISFLEFLFASVNENINIFTKTNHLKKINYKLIHQINKNFSGLFEIIQKESISIIINTERIKDLFEILIKEFSNYLFLEDKEAFGIDCSPEYYFKNLEETFYYEQL